ncbi:hypothetical protein AZE42_13656 [Rhizopogon vesiculosus]|uniref:Uncharacterized protein n=1 Tax=Rhizopogon vesiculosus TaxID=180088 RepID=A0A1J8R1D4_9AGAM|nr:hypothetical protein AZE42_13656 [Rhizopogon vesiculosus]
MDRPAHQWIEDVGGWVKDEGGVWGKEGESDESLFWHRVGRFVKAGYPTKMAIHMVIATVDVRRANE